MSLVGHNFGNVCPGAEGTSLNVGCASPRVYWVHDRHVKTTGLKNPVLVSVRRSKLAREIKRP